MLGLGWMGATAESRTAMSARISGEATVAEATGSRLDGVGSPSTLPPVLTTATTARVVSTVAVTGARRPQVPRSGVGSENAVVSERERSAYSASLTARG